MKLNNIGFAGMLALTMIGTQALPTFADAQSKKQTTQRQKSKNEWRNFAYAGGGVALLGLLTKDSRLTLLGSLGGLYSVWRYEQDRKSQSKTDRARAALYSQKTFVDNGYRYNRQTKWKNGKKYYTFQKTKLR
jgi:hypothetical protein